MRSAGVAGWCIHHPVSTLMLTLTAIVLGLFALSRLSIDLLPQLIYPEIGVRIIDPAVPANIMEDQVTRQLEEQLAITEDSVGVTSTTLEGTAEVELYFDYGKDIDVALRDAAPGQTNAFEMRVGVMEFIGNHFATTLHAVGTSLNVSADLSMNAVRDLGIQPGGLITVRLPADRLRVFLPAAD